MQATRSFKQAFLKQMLAGFRLSAASGSSMSLQERKTAVKLSADVAMAFARGGCPKWTRGLLSRLAREEKNQPFLRCVLGSQYERLTKPCYDSFYSKWKVPRSKKIVRRSLIGRKTRKSTSVVAAARNLAERRTQVLKRLVPGGESLSGFSLLDETLDYVVSLRAQVDLMQNLLTTFEASKIRAHEHKRKLPEMKAV